MCILFVFVGGEGADAHEAAWAKAAAKRYRLIIASNRDEYVDRPARRVARWVDAKGVVVAGRDAVGGGTWLGVAGESAAAPPNKRWAALTNVREPPAPGAGPFPSRGALCASFLRGDEGTSAEAAARGVAGETRYDGFNAIFGDGDGAWYATNRGGNDGATRLAPGPHALSNGRLGAWPKCARLRDAAVAAITARGGGGDDDALAAALLACLGDGEPCAPAVGTGCGPDFEAKFAYVDVPLCRLRDGDAGLYGTRTRTVILVGVDGGVTIVERDLREGAWADTALRFAAS